MQARQRVGLTRWVAPRSASFRAGALVRPQAAVSSGAVRFAARRVLRLVVVAAASNRREADGLWSAF